MRNILSIKGIPAPITEDGVRWNEQEGLISFNVNGETVLTIQDKNIGATKTAKYYKTSTEKLYSPNNEYGTLFTPSYSSVSGNTAVMGTPFNTLLTQQGLLPQGTHVFNATDMAKIPNVSSISGIPNKYRMMLIPIGSYFTVDVDTGETVRQMTWTNDDYKNTAYKSPSNTYLRLALDEVVLPLSKGRVEISTQNWINVTKSEQSVDFKTTDYGYERVAGSSTRGSMGREEGRGYYIDGTQSGTITLPYNISTDFSIGSLVLDFTSNGNAYRGYIKLNNKIIANGENTELDTYHDFSYPIEEKGLYTYEIYIDAGGSSRKIAISGIKSILYTETNS